MSLYGDLIPELNDDSGTIQEAKRTQDKIDTTTAAPVVPETSSNAQETPISAQNSSNTSSGMGEAASLSGFALPLNYD